MTDSPFDPPTGEISVTLKAGKDFGDPWIVVRGSSAADVKQRVADAVGITDHEGLTLVELTVNAKQSFQAANNVSGVLGGTALPRPSAPKAAAAAPAAAPAADKGPDLLDEIGKIGSKPEGQKFYLANRSKIDGDAELKAAITAKMASL